MGVVYVKSNNDFLNSCNDEIKCLRIMIKNAENTAVKNVFIALLNDQISQKNRYLENIHNLPSDEVMSQRQSEIWIHQENKDNMKHTPVIISILSKRKKIKLSKLIQIAESIEIEVLELMELEEYSKDYFLPA